MKRLFSIGLAACFSVALLTACTNSSSSSSSTSSSISKSTAPGSSSISSSINSTPLATSFDVEGVLNNLSEVAGLGATISMSDLDLKAIGLNMDNIVGWAGAQSQLVAQNGGTVIVIEAKPGTADEMKATLEKYRDLLANDDRYQDYATALLNIGEARIVVNENIIVYAVSALGQEGGYDALDAAINALFA